jgi:hypothetical protein
MAVLKDTANNRIDMNSSGTEAAPYSIETVVTDINDTTYIEQVGKVIYLKKSILTQTGFLQIKDYITLVFRGGVFINNNNNAATPTNGIELVGGCVLVFENNGGYQFGSGAQTGTGIIKMTQKNGLYPTIRQQSGARHDMFISILDTLTSSNYNNVIFKIDGLNIQLSNEAHLKWYTKNANSYIKNINIQRAASGYTGATPTAFQLSQGTNLYDPRSSEFAIAGDLPETSNSKIYRPYFDITTSSSLAGYFWSGTDVALIDPKYAPGGSWNNKISPNGVNGNSGNGIGSRIRHKTSYNLTVAKGNTKIQNAKIALFPTKITSIAVPAGLTSEAVSNTYLLTDVNGSIAEQLLLYKEFFPITTTADTSSNTTTTWRITARHPLYNIQFEIQATAGANSLLVDSVSAVDNQFCTLTTAQCTAITSPYIGVVYNKATKTITLTANRTVAELRNNNYWWLFQDNQMDYTDAFNTLNSVYDIADWNIIGNNFLTDEIKTTGSMTFNAINSADNKVTATTITVTGVNRAYLTSITSITGLNTTGNISTNGKLGFGTGSTINATGDMVISGTELSGTLTINTVTNRKLTLTNCTGSLTGFNVTGGGNVTVIFNSTARSVLPTTLTNVTVGYVKSLVGVSDCFVEIKDNLNNTVIAYSLTNADFTHETISGRTYTAKIRRLGYENLTSTYDSSAAAVNIQLVRDKVLWPLDSTKTVANLRTDADALTGYTLANNGDLTFPSNGTLKDAYLSFSRQAEQSLSKTIPAYNGTTMTGLAAASMTAGKLTETGILTITGSWTGTLGTVTVNDSAGGSKKLSGVTDCYVQVKDNLNNVTVAYAKQSTDLYFKTTTGRTYSVTVRQIGSYSYTTTLDASSAEFAITLTRDKVLWPLDSTDTVATLRTSADSLTNYSLAANGNIGAPDGCTLASTYLAVSRFVELDVTKTLPNYSSDLFTNTGNFTLTAGSSGITGNGTLTIVGTYTGSIGTVTVNDSNGGTKFINGITDCYVSVDDNTNTSVIGYSLKTGAIGFKTTTGKTYTILARQLGSSSFTATVDASSATYTVSLTRDRTLWPLDSTDTVSDLRIKADGLTGYVLNSNGNLEFPSDGTLSKAYLSFNRQQEQTKNKVVPVYNGILMNGTGNATMTSGKLSGTGTLTITGTWSGTLGSVIINDADGGTKTIAGTNDYYVSMIDDLGNVLLPYAKQTQDYLFKSSNQRQYNLVVRRLGYQPFTATIDGSSGTYTPSLNRDKILWPLDSTKTVADLRTEASLITDYLLSSNGNLSFKNSGNLKDAYLSFSLQQEIDSTKLAPKFDGTTMVGLSDATMKSVSGNGLSGSGILSVAGNWTGEITEVGIEDSNGVRVVVKELESVLCNLQAIYNYQLTGESEVFSSQLSRHILTVGKGKILRIAIGAKGYNTQYRNIGTIDKPQSISIILSNDTNIDPSVDLNSGGISSWNNLVKFDNLNTVDNTLKILVKTGTFNPALAQSGLADLTNKEQYLRLVNRLETAALMTTTTSGIKLSSTNITIMTDNTVGDYDNVEILAYVEGPTGFVINPKSTGGLITGPDKSQVVVTKVRPQIAKVETEQMSAIAMLARDYIERDAGMLKKIINPKITKN